jgi:FHA domain-containing protein/regulatory LuxR family protein
MGFTPHSLTPGELASLLEVERRGAPFLAYKDGAGDLRLLSLGEHGEITVGRVPENDVALDWDPEVSRTHAQLELVGAGWTVADDGLSRNGTFVNGERVHGRRRLVDGDLIRIGQVKLVFRAPGPAAESTAVVEEAALVRLTQGEHRVLVSLCRPLLAGEAGAVPATNREIAEELSLSPDGVKTHVRSLFAKLGIEDLPQYRKRTELGRRALDLGLVTPRHLRD